MNGALTIGTLDGANIEIRDEVGAENFFLFGKTAREVKELWRQGYHPRAIYDLNPELREAIDCMASGAFCHAQKDLFRPLVDSLLNHDPFMVLADYQSYIDCQDAVARAYRDREHWTTMSILNAARMGRFSSDRAIQEYCRDIWDIPVRLSQQTVTRKTSK
jgi:starch phosphorylase